MDSIAILRHSESVLPVQISSVPDKVAAAAFLVAVGLAIATPTALFATADSIFDGALGFAVSGTVIGMYLSLLQLNYSCKYQGRRSIVKGNLRT